jgi:hypothetical protein
LICIDPGKKTGWAYFKGEALDACGLAEPPFRVPFLTKLVLIEKPMIYPRSKARPNDIVELAIVAGQISAQWAPYVTWVLPRQWKGTIDGDAMHVRIIKTLTEAERGVYFAAADEVAESYRHNIADAIGIGLWKLGRLDLRAGVR